MRSIKRFSHSPQKTNTMHGNNSIEVEIQMLERRRLNDLKAEQEALRTKIYNAGWDYDFRDSALLRDLEIRIAIIQGEDLVFANDTSIY